MVDVETDLGLRIALIKASELVVGLRVNNNKTIYKALYTLGRGRRKGRRKVRQALTQKVSYPL